MKKTGTFSLRALCALAGTALLPAIALAQPANDNCGSPATASLGANAGDSTLATNDAPSPTCGFDTSFTEDVWFVFTPAATGAFQIDTNGSLDPMDDTVVSIHTGACGALTEVACDDDGGTGLQSLITTSLNGGTPYLIRVAGYTGAEGPFVLNITSLVLLGNDLCTSAETLPLNVSTPGDNTTATLDGDPPTCSIGDTNDVWYTFTPPGPLPRLYRVTVTPTSATLDAIISAHPDCAQTTTLGCADATLDGAPETFSLAGTPGTPILIRVAAYEDAFFGDIFPGPFNIIVEDVGSLLANDACSGAITIDTMTPGTGNTGAASSEGVTATCTSGINDQWFTFTAPTAGAPSGFWSFTVSGPAGNSVSLWSACGGTQLACNLANAGFDAVAGVSLADGATVKIRVAGFGDAVNDFTVTVAEVPAPANDTCASAETVTIPGTASPSLFAAGDDADVACNAAANTSLRSAVWYTLTAPMDGTLLVGESSGTDVAIALYTGTCGSLTEVACSDPEPASFSVTNGTVYYVAVGLWSATASATNTPLALTFEMPVPPDNDDCEAAEALTTSPVVVDGRAASDDSNVSPTCDLGTGAANNGVWYTYTTGADGGILSLSEDSVNDVILSVYSGAGCGALTQVSCSDGETNAATTLAANTTYYVMVSLWSETATPTAPYSMSFTFAAATGACCQAGGVCSFTTNSNCNTLSGVWQGANVPCIGPPSPSGSEYSSTDTFPLSIPDDDVITGVSSTVTISGSGVTIGASGIAVNVGLTHTYCSDLVAELTNGTNTVDLFININGFDSTNLGAIYTFIDQGASIDDAAAALGTADIIPAGTYSVVDGQGLGSALGFNGQPLDGTWTLTVFDDTGSDTGTITSFSIQNAAPGAPTCSSCPAQFNLANFTTTGPSAGQVDVTDLFDFLDAWFAQTGVCLSMCSADVAAPFGGSPDVTDLFDFLDAWFAQNGNTCP